MKRLLSIYVLSSLAVAGSAQESTTSTPETTTKPAATVSASEPIKNPESLPHRKEVGQPTAVTRSSFQERLKAIIEKGDSLPGQAPAKPLSGNYQIKIDRTLNGKSASLRLVTAAAKFSYQGLGTSVMIDGNSIPSTMDFEGELSHEAESSIFFQFFYGQTVPVVTGTYFGGSGKGSTSQYQQIQIGMKNGITFPFGKPLKVVESDGETLVITISKLEP